MCIKNQAQRVVWFGLLLLVTVKWNVVLFVLFCCCCFCLFFVAVVLLFLFVCLLLLFLCRCFFVFFLGGGGIFFFLCWGGGGGCTIFKNSVLKFQNLQCTITGKQKANRLTLIGIFIDSRLCSVIRWSKSPGKFSSTKLALPSSGSFLVQCCKTKCGTWQLWNKIAI